MALDSHLLLQSYAEPIVYYTTYNLKSFSALKAKGCVPQPIFQHICDQQHVFPENNCTTSHGRYASRTCRSVSGLYPGDPSQLFVLHLMRIIINDFSLLLTFVTAFLFFFFLLSPHRAHFQRDDIYFVDSTLIPRLIFLQKDMFTYVSLHLLL